MGGACSTNWGEYKHKLWQGYPNARTHVEKLGVDDRIILKCLLKIQDSKSFVKFIWISLGRNAKHLGTRQ
jgi:hypothetical protein